MQIEKLGQTNYSIKALPWNEFLIGKVRHF